MEELKPQSKGKPDVNLRYDPSSETMRHDSVFSEVAPGVVDSGLLKHKWGGEGEHIQLSNPPSELRGD